MPTLVVATTAALPPAGTIVRVKDDGGMWSNKAVKILNYPDPFTANVEATWGNRNQTLLPIDRLSNTIVNNHPLGATVAPTTDPAARFAGFTYVDYDPQAKTARRKEPTVRISSRRISFNKEAIAVLQATLAAPMQNGTLRLRLRWSKDAGVLAISAAPADEVALQLSLSKDTVNGWISTAGFFSQFGIAAPAKPVNATPQPYGDTVYIELAKAIREGNK